MSKRLILLAIFMAFVSYIKACNEGFDTIMSVSVDTFKCLLNNNINYFIGRVYENTGVVDNIGVQNIINARSAKVNILVDGYIEPCVSSILCPPASQQAESAINAINKNGAKIGRIWINVQDNQWPNSTTKNQNFITSMANQILLMKPQVGILTNEISWRQIAGNWTGANQWQLWWANTTNGDKTYIGWNLFQFGGWRAPVMHQYAQNVRLPCNITGNNNWFL